jgi:WD40 repeat protein
MAVCVRVLRSIMHLTSGGEGEAQGERSGAAIGTPSNYDYDVFVIHAKNRDDEAFVVGHLLPKLGVPPLRPCTSADLTPGLPILAEIKGFVSRSAITLILCSEAFTQDALAEYAQQLASHRDVASRQHRLVPVVRASDVPKKLALDHLTGVELYGDPDDWDENFDRLRKRIAEASNTSRLSAPPRSRLRCPYPGLQPYSEDDRRVFFGRESEIQEILAKLAAVKTARPGRELYVIGPSGSGKSSLLFAGVLPRLKKDFSPTECDVRPMRPGAKPTERLRELLRGPAERFAANSPAHPVVVLVFDQLEEIFALAGKGERAAFFAELRALRQDPRCVLLSTLRADFYDEFMNSELWSDLHERPLRVDVGPLRGDALREAIEGPAHHHKVWLESRLVERLVGDAESEPGALPLLQVAMGSLWRRLEHGYLFVEDYERLGDGKRSGLAVALANLADDAFGQLTAPAEQEVARRILLRLVHFGEGRAHTRRQRRKVELLVHDENVSVFERVLHVLSQGRILTLSSEAMTGRRDRRAPEDLVDLSHEVLITAWPMLAQLVESRQSDERMRRSLDARARRWAERVAEGRGGGLFDKAELEEVEAWMARETAREVGYSDELQRLVEKTRERVESDEQQRRGEEHQRRQRAALAYYELGRTLLLNGHPMRALPYLAAARSEGVDGRAMRILFADALRAAPRVILGGHASAVNAVSFDTAGRRIVTAGEDGFAHVWDVRSGRQLVALAHEAAVAVAEFSPDGRRILTAGADGTARIWEASTGKPLTPALRHDGTVAVVRGLFTPDGRWVITATEDDMGWGVAVCTWDPVTGERMSSTPVPDRRRFLAFSHDGTRALVARENTAEVWDARSNTIATPRLACARRVTAAAFSRDGSVVATGSSDGDVRLWNATDGTPSGRSISHGGQVFAMAFSPDGSRIMTGASGRALIWDAQTGQPLISPLESELLVLGVAFSNGSFVATASNDHYVRIWDSTGTVRPRRRIECDEEITGMAVSPCGDELATAHDGTIHVWEASSGQVVSAAVGVGPIGSLRFSPDGQTLIAGVHGVGIVLCDAATGQVRSTWLDPPRTLTGGLQGDALRVELVWDGVTRFESTDGRVWICDVSTGEPLVGPIDATGGSVSDVSTGEPVPGRIGATGGGIVSFAPSANRVVTVSKDASRTARLWNSSTLELVRELDDGVNAVEFGPGGQLVTGGYNGATRAWDPSSGEPLPWETGSGRETRVAAHQEAVAVIAFSPDGERVLTGSIDSTARLRSITTGRELTPALVHPAGVIDAKFSPDGALVITHSDDEVTYLWDASTGKLLRPPIRDTLFLGGFTGDGAHFVTGGDRSVDIWTLAANDASGDDWNRLARCSPFALGPDGLVSNLEQLDATHVSAPHAVVSAANAGARVRCPKCWWQPSPDSRWSCTCGMTWNTFETHGKCPQCDFVWPATSCLKCSEASRHEDWYKS